MKVFSEPMKIVKTLSMAYNDHNRILLSIDRLDDFLIFVFLQSSAVHVRPYSVKHRWGRETVTEVPRSDRLGRGLKP